MVDEANRLVILPGIILRLTLHGLAAKSIFSPRLGLTRFDGDLILWGKKLHPAPLAARKTGGASGSPRSIVPETRDGSRLFIEATFEPG